MKLDKLHPARWPRKLVTIWAVVSVLFLLSLVVVGVYGVVRWTDDEPVTYADDAEHFKYGSTGGERGYMKQFGFGIPYWIWITLPELFPDYLPDDEPGYSSFGMIYEEGKNPRFDLPIGMSMRRVQGIDRVYFNCAVCHTGSVRPAPDADRRIVLGMPANTFNLGRLSLFLQDAASNWRFRASRMMPKIRDMADERDSLIASGELPDDVYRPDRFNVVDRTIFRWYAMTLMREQILTLISRLSFLDHSSWGPGRVDTFNPPKALLGFPMRRAPEREKMGNADFPSVWNQRWKEGMQLHWDGNNTSVDERNLSAGFGTGATPTTVDEEKILRVADWLWDEARPPSFPEQHLDRALANRGAPIYRRHCWECHGNGRPPFREEGDETSVGQVTPIEEIGTDRARLDSYTRELAVAQNLLYAGFPEDEEYCAEHPDDRDRCYPARFSHFRKTHGYANVPLDGLWLRAPYLHNGSVPTLRALLAPPAERPDTFYTGYDVYDYEDVGFVSRGPDAAREGWLFDTHARGNGNGGHVYGTTLSESEKDALIEYLKTF